MGVGTGGVNSLVSHVPRNTCRLYCSTGGWNKAMSQETNLHLAQQFLKLMADQAAPVEIATLFSPDVRFEIPGEAAILPWIGRNTGRSAVMTFVTGLRTLTEPVGFDVRDVLANDTRAVILV